MVRRQKSLTRDRISHLVSSKSMNQTLTISASSSDDSEHSAATSLITTLSFAELGTPSGTPALLIFGLGGHRYLISLYQTVAIRHNVRLLCIDRCGKGLTTPVSTKISTIDAVTSSIASLLKHLGISKVRLFSHSLGGIFALALLRDRPDLVDTSSPIHLLSPWCAPSWPGIKSRYFVHILQKSPAWMIKFFAWTTVSGMRMLSYAPKSIQGIFMPSYKGCEKEFTRSHDFTECSQQIAKVIKRENYGAGFEYDLCMGCERWGDTDFVLEKAVGATVKVWWGERDKLVLEESARELCTKLGADLEIVPQGSHDLVFNMDVIEKVFTTFGANLHERAVSFEAPLRTT